MTQQTFRKHIFLCFSDFSMMTECVLKSKFCRVVSRSYQCLYISWFCPFCIRYGLTVHIHESDAHSKPANLYSKRNVLYQLLCIFEVSTICGFVFVSAVFIWELALGCDLNLFCFRCKPLPKVEGGNFKWLWHSLEFRAEWYRYVCASYNKGCVAHTLLT